MHYFMESYINRKVEVEERTDDFFSHGEFEGILPYLTDKGIIADGVFPFKHEKPESHNVLLEPKENRVIPYLESIGFTKSYEQKVKAPDFWLPIGENSTSTTEEERESKLSNFVRWYGKVELYYIHDHLQAVKFWEKIPNGNYNNRGKRCYDYIRTLYTRKVD